MLTNVARGENLEIQWSAPKPSAEGCLRLRGQSPERRAMAALRWTARSEGTTARFHLASAPSAVYGDRVPVFARIFDSFRIVETGVGTPPAAAVPDLAYRRFADPHESAFTLDVPEGWSIEGGLRRINVTDVRVWMRLASPDGAIRLFIRDPDIPIFVTPSAMLAQYGFRQGTWYNGMYVQPYQNGVQFAEGFARQLGVPCGGITVHERRNLAEQVAASNAMYRQFGLPLTIDLGELSFSCGSGGQAVSGYSLAGSVVYNMDAVYNVGAGGIWYVEYLMAYLASPGREAEAASVLERMTRSFTVNPAWYAAQTHATLQTARDNLKTSKEIMGMIEDVFQHRRVSVGRMYDRHLGVVANTRVMRDPLTGKEYTIRGNHEYVWIDQQGRTVYTKTADNPDLRYYRALVGD